MMENYKRTVELTETAYNSAGKASEQFAKYQDTVEYKTKQLANSWEQLRTSFLDSSTYKEVLDFLNKVMDTLGDMDLSQFAALGIIGLTAGKSVVSKFIAEIQTGLANSTQAWETGLTQAINKIQVTGPLMAKALQITRSLQTAESEASITRTAQNAKWLVELTQVRQKIREYIFELRELIASGDVQNANEQEKIEYLREQLRLLREQHNAVRARLIDRGGMNLFQIGRARHVLQIQDDPEAAARRDLITSTTTQAISAGLTTALMMAISGADFETVFKTAFTSALVAAVPTIFSAVIPKAIAYLSGPAGWVALVIAAITAISVAIYKHFEKIKKSNEAVRDAELKRLKDVEETNKKLQKQQQESIKNLKANRKEQQKINDLQEDYNRLSQKSFLTTSEQEELDNIVDTLTSDYDDLISSFDENTNKITFNTAAIKDLTETLKEEEEGYVQDAKSSGQMQAYNISFALSETKDVLDELQNIDLSAEWNEDKEQLILPFTYARRRPTGDHDTGYASVDFSQAIEKAPIIGLNVNRDRREEEVLRSAEEYVNLVNSLPDLLKEKLGLSQGDFTTDTFESWLAATPKYKDSENPLSEFVSDVKLEYDKILEDSDDLILESVQSGAKEYYKTFTAAGEQIGEEVAADLAQGIEDVDIEDTTDKYIQTKGLFKGLSSGQINAINVNEGTRAELKEILAEFDLINEDGDFVLEKDDWKDFKKFPEKFQNFLNNLGTTAESWEVMTEDSDRDAELAKAFNTYYAARTEDLYNIDQTAIESEADNINKYNQLQEKALQYNLEQYEQEVSKILGEIDDNTVKNALDNANFDSKTNVNVQNFENNIGKFSELLVDGYSDLSLGIQNTILGIVAEANLSETSSGKFAQDLVDSYQDLTPAVQGVLASIDVVNGTYATLMSNSYEYIKAIAEAGSYSIQDAEKIYDDYISTSLGYLTKTIYGKDGAQLLNSQLQDQIYGFAESYSVLYEAEQEYLENGNISIETAAELREANFDHFISHGKHGYELLTEEAEKAWVEQAELPKKILEQQRKALNDAKAEANKMSKVTIKTSYETTMTEAEYLNEHGNTEENALTYRALVDAGTAPTIRRSIEDVNGLIEVYNKYGISSKEFQQATEGQSAALVDYAIKVAEAGFVTESEYIRALNQAETEINKLTPQIDLQVLYTIADAAGEAAERVKDLEEELDDLKKQLAEDELSKIEADKKRNEARYGSEDYQASLDEFVNYERRITNINDELTKTKELLSDVSSIDDAKKNLNAIFSLYEDKIAVLQAENRVIDESIANLDKEILKNYGDFVYFDETGNMGVDLKALESARKSDILKDEGFIKMFEKRNELYDTQVENERTILENEEEINQMYEEAREKRIEMEESVIDILKEQMQEEIDAVTDKYEALEEADNNYLEALEAAINKQRELREQEKSYEDLATKEKKLSLMQRDTSGANKKEIMSLEEDIEDDREKLLDNEVDNLIKSMKELYEKQQEARELEIKAMEETVLDMQLINQTAMAIIKDFSTVEDYQAWLLENNPALKEMTDTQIESYLSSAEDTFSGYAEYVAHIEEDMALKSENIAQKTETIFSNTSEKASELGSIYQKLAESAAQKAIDEADLAYKKAVEKFNETQAKITETVNKLSAAEDTAVEKHSTALAAMVEASKSAMLDVAAFAVDWIVKMNISDLSDRDMIKKYARTIGMYDEKTDSYDQVYISAISGQGGDTSWMKAIDRTGFKVKKGAYGSYSEEYYKTYEEARASAESFNEINKNGPALASIYSASEEGHGFYIKDKNGNILEDYYVGMKAPDGTQINTLKQALDWAERIYEEILIASPGVKPTITQYKTGGLVDYTGPAWVDGTPQKPESFLSAEDTARIGAAAKLLADLPIFNTTSNAENAVSTNIGDTSIEIHINVESISDDYDVDQMIERVKQDIVDVAKPIGTSVILNK